MIGDGLRNGTLVKAHELSIPGYGFYLAYLADHPRSAVIEAFGDWMRSVA